MARNIITDAYYLLKAVDEGIVGLCKSGVGYGAQVGCVLTDINGAIIAQAHNGYLGGIRRHAEEIVLSDLVREGLSGTTLYLTIEPCNGNPFHKRKHCCEQIVDAGVERVVLGSLKRKYEGGVDFLRQHGVTYDLLENSSLNTLCSLLSPSDRPGAVISKRSYSKLMMLRMNFNSLLE